MSSRLTREESEKFEHAPEMTAELREVIEPDIFITGDANLLIEPEEKRDAKWDRHARRSPCSCTSPSSFS